MSRYTSSLLSLLAIVIVSSAATLCPAAQKAEKADNSPKTETKAPKPPADPNVVATIADYQITKQEVLNRLMEEIRPEDDLNLDRARHTNSETVARMLLADKALIMDARKQGLLKDETIAESLKDFRSRRIVGLLIQKILSGKINVTQAEIDAVVKANPKITPAAAKSRLQTAKASNVLQRYYNNLVAHMDVKKVTENLPKAAELHRKLMEAAKGKSPMVFIRSQQVREDLTQKQKDIPLVTYKGGVYTVRDFFNTICSLAPPRRPDDLGTTQGVSKFLDSAIRLPIFALDAEAKGYGQDKQFLDMMKKQEDMHLLSKAKMDLFDSISEPNDQQIVDFYNEHKADFVEGRKVKIDQIWCENRAQADKVKAELDKGGDFDAVKQKYSQEKDTKPFDTYQSSEGLFWDDIYAAKAGTIVGPIKGFHRDAVYWRVVKIIDKQAGKPLDISTDNNKNKVKWKLWSQLRYDVMMKKYAKALAEYPYTLYENRLKAIDPLNIK